MSPGGLERDIGWHRGLVRPVMLGHDASRSPGTFSGRVETRLGLPVGGLEDLVGLMVAVPGIHRADDREPVEHRRQLGQVLASETPGSLVGMTPNGPRFWSGRSGFGSKVSMWLGPPAIQSRMTALFP